MDIVDDLANPLPALITLDLLGLPLENWERYAHVLHEAAYRAKGSAKGVAWLLSDLTAIVEQRRIEPAAITTPLDAMLAADVDGQPLSVEIVVEMVFMLLNGGIDTSTALIAHSLRYLSGHPELRQALIEDPSLINAAVDEFLRYSTPGTGLGRTLAEDTIIDGVALPAGARIYLALGAANTDPDEFPEPDRVDFHRDGNRHLAFGAGLHRCLGSFLAPCEMSILLEEILRRMPDFTVDEDGVLAYPTIPLVGGFQAMPATFTPGPKIGRVPTDGVPPARDARDLLAAAELAAAEESVESDDLSGASR
jgi:cytochrome P450